MQHNYTQEELLQYIYNELDADAFEGIRNELKDNVELNEEFELYNRLIKYLDLIEEKPNPTSVEIIMEYSRAFENES